MGELCWHFKKRIILSLLTRTWRELMQMVTKTSPGCCKKTQWRSKDAQFYFVYDKLQGPSLLHCHLWLQSFWSSWSLSIAFLGTFTERQWYAFQEKPVPSSQIHSKVRNEGSCTTAAAGTFQELSLSLGNAPASQTTEFKVGDGRLTCIVYAKGLEETS